MRSDTQDAGAAPASAGGNGHAHPHKIGRGWAGRAAHGVEPITEAIERSGWLDRTANVVTSAFAKAVRPGPLKDLLSGTWMGHPLHPMLTDVVIGSWTSAMLLDIASGEDGSKAADGLVGVGIVAAVPTAVSGLSDLADVVNEEDRAVGAAHAIGNSIALGLQVLSYGTRKRGARGAGVALSMASMVVASASAFLGGHLTYRRAIGVDQTAFRNDPDDWISVVPEAELGVGERRRVNAGGDEIMLFRTDERVYALANRCTHRGGPLHKGKGDDATVRCPWHGSTFALEDGSIVTGPATAPQPTYEVRIADGMIALRARNGHR